MTKVLFATLLGATAAAQPAPTPRFLGPASCSSSSCHGGASTETKQYTVWSNYDFHHARPYATLTTARSAQIAAAAKLDNPTQNPRCTACHAPFATVPAERLAKGVEVNAGVSCENCHGPAENWLRAHTRRDLAHADKVALGIRDLKNLYVRANTCVACHQNVDADLLAAGHPELIFELDGQAVSETKHWRESEKWSGPQTWFVGQAVALREMSWQLAREKSPEENAANRWAGLRWLLDQAAAADKSFPAPPGSLAVNAESLQQTQRWADDLARHATERNWSSQLSKGILAIVAGTAAAFGDTSTSVQLHARRAERLVLALDRLVAGLNQEQQLGAALNQLFKDAQSLPDFEPARFAEHLKAFQTAASHEP